MTHEEILAMLGDYVDYLIANSSAEAPMWNIEKVRSGSVRGIGAHSAITPPRGGHTARFALAVMSFSHMPSASHEL